MSKLLQDTKPHDPNISICVLCDSPLPYEGTMVCKQCKEKWNNLPSDKSNSYHRNATNINLKIEPQNTKPKDIKNTKLKNTKSKNTKSKNSLRNKKSKTPVIHSYWEIDCDGYYPYCANCLQESLNGKKEEICPTCGAIMDKR